jgi:hypothetical protein
MNPPRPVIMTAFYIVLLLSMAVFIWVFTPSSSPKLILILLGWALVVGRVYLEVRFRRSSWSRVLRLSSSSKPSEPCTVANHGSSNNGN